MKELRNTFCWISPPDATPTTRKIPEGSTVRRRLFADDGPAEPSGNRNMINSAVDVDRMMQEDTDRAARRWGFDIQREEPIPNGALSWMNPGELRGEIRKRKMQEALAASRRDLEIITTAQNKLRKILDEPDMPYIASMGILDNLTNNLMDDSRDYYAESVQHWNFDFDNKMPAAGTVVWQQVGSHWVGNKPETFTRLVLYPNETKKVNTSISHEESREELTKGKADESDLKPTDKIEHLFTEHVNAIYGDWKREMKIGIKTATIITARRELDRDTLNDMRLLQTTNQHHLITKSEAIAMIRDKNTNDDDDNSDDDNSVDDNSVYDNSDAENSDDDNSDDDICEDSTSKKCGSL